MKEFNDVYVPKDLARKRRRVNDAIVKEAKKGNKKRTESRKKFYACECY